MFAAETNKSAVPRSNLPDFANAWRKLAEPVDPFLKAVSRHLAEQVNEFDPTIAGYAHYALSVQGKQLRPLLVALSARSVGELQEAHVRIATIIEMVHLATLVHDDVMDEAEIRRNRPTVAANWGNEISVLVGDCLFAQALSLASDFPTTEVCRAVASATRTVCSGEILQTQRRWDFDISREDYFKAVTMKTGELFALSCDLGGRAEGDSNPSSEILRKVGLALGTAYQIYDDCLDLFGSEAATGKSLGTDLIKGKLTLPVIIALERLSVTERALFQESMRSCRPATLVDVLEQLEQIGALDASREVIHEYLEIARRLLRQLPCNPGTMNLMGVIDYLAGQVDGVKIFATG